MQELIEEAIVRKARSVLNGIKASNAVALKNADRYNKRTGETAGLPSTSAPTWWRFHPHFDPCYCITHAKYISKTIWRKLQADSYTPVPAIQFDLPKADGTSRKIMAFSVPDSALPMLYTGRQLKEIYRYSRDLAMLIDLIRMFLMQLSICLDHLSPQNPISFNTISQNTLIQ